LWQDNLNIEEEDGEKEKMRNFLKEYVSEFEKLTEDLPRLSGGISRSEAFAFCGLCKFYDIDVVIDSGTGRGVSGEYFARTQKQVITIDLHSHYENSEELSSILKEYDNIEYIIGNAVIEIPKLLLRENGKRCAIFFDGPKNITAFEFSQTLDIVFCGFHDVIKGGSFSELFDGKDGTIFHTHDEWFATEYNRLNRNRIQTKGYPNGVGAVFYES
jgi:hypothetical protein